jgi:hypothetical protein
MNRDSLAKDKFYSDCHKQHSISKERNQPQQVKQMTKPILESGIIVTMCLASCDECNERYDDNTGKFKIQCRCKCHNSPNLLLEENKKSACLQ